MWKANKHGFTSGTKVNIVRSRERERERERERVTLRVRLKSEAFRRGEINNRHIRNEDQDFAKRFFFLERKKPKKC